MIGDLCAGAGLAADGYATVFGRQAIHGFDLYPQPDYPYLFTQADVMPLLEDPRSLLTRFAALHVSLPCQAHTTAGHLRTAQGGTSRFGDLLTPGLVLLRERWGHMPWIVENVDDRSGNVRKIMAPQSGETLIVLCGSMFGLEIQRHRLFLANFPLRRPHPIPKPQWVKGKPGKYREQGCDHSLFPADPVTGSPRPWGVYHTPGDAIPDGGRTCRDAAHAREVMGVTRDLPWESIKEGFPPAYTARIAADLLVELERRQAA